MKQFDDARLIIGFDDLPERGRPVCESAGMRYTPHIEAGKNKDVPIPPGGQGDRIRNVPRPWLDSLIRETPPPATMEDERIATEMILGAYQSSENGYCFPFKKGYPVYSVVRFQSVSSGSVSSVSVPLTPLSPSADAVMASSFCSARARATALTLAPACGVMILTP